MSIAHRWPAVPPTFSEPHDLPRDARMVSVWTARAQRRECLSCGVHTHERAPCSNCGGPTAPVEELLGAVRPTQLSSPHEYLSRSSRAFPAVIDCRPLRP